MKGCKFLPMLDTHTTVTRATVHNGHRPGPVTLAPISERLAVELSLPVFTELDLSRLGFEHPTFSFRGQRANLLRHRYCLFV